MLLQLHLKLDVVKHVIAVKKEENSQAVNRNAKSTEKQKLLGILARKEAAELEGKSAEEIKAIIDQLD